MTEKIYHVDSYIKYFTANVIELDEEAHGIILDRTAFYPGGGGQPADKGYIEFKGTAIPIIRSKKIGDKIVHLIDKDITLPPVGSTVKGHLDWELRYKLMRTHSAMHILCGVIFRDYGATVTGGNMEPLKGRMDFEFEAMHKELVEKIENAINQEVKNARPITWRTLPREEAFKIPDLIRTKINLLPKGINKVRIVEIEGLDLQADGGTHVKNTKEVGTMRIIDYKSKGKINKRIYVQLSE
ncbi:MAG: alanyl-tRNA editing protein [Anaerolineales bacterium]|nr:alanyl-tRNA editing protein [Anaerolineales bacterium]HEY61890.1 alanyl-tRNA editing protein [Anaerolineae bacterium]